MGVREEKNILREKYKEIKANITDEQKQVLDEMVYNSFINSMSYKHCDSLIIYVSRKDEVDTLKIIQKALLDNKRVAVPKCIPHKIALEFYEIKNMSDLEKGHYGILEPNKDKCKKINPHFYSICIVPAISFDIEGFRIGFGKGYYDRFLEKFEGLKIGITYSLLITKKLPRGRFDQNIELIVSEKGVKRVEKSH